MSLAKRVYATRMLRFVVSVAVVVAVDAACLASCQAESAPTSPPRAPATASTAGAVTPTVATVPGIKFPPAPFAISAPSEPTSLVAGVDLRTVSIEDLLRVKLTGTEPQRLAAGYALTYWTYRRAPESQTVGAGTVAVFAARLQLVDEVFYWLQQAALHEGLDPESAKATSFARVHQDARWPNFLRYLENISAVWRRSGYRRQPVIVPAGYKVGTPIAALICLHGYGSRPEDFTTDDKLQRFADDTGMAVVSLSATTPRGQQSFMWSEQFETDWTHIQKGLALVKDRVTLAPSGNIAVGFSQGAQLGMELAVAHPEFFNGAIAMSPGYLGTPRLAAALAKGNKATAQQTYFVVWYDQERPASVALAKRDVAELRTAGARVIAHEYLGEYHTFAPDIDDNFAIWSQLLREKR